MDKLPKSIKDIREQYKPSTPQFYEEIYKHIISLNDESMKWGNSLSHLTREEITGTLKYKRDYINGLVIHFIECIDNPSDYIQFNDIDQFVKFANCAISVNQDVATNQQLIAFLIDLVLTYNRWPSMNGLSKILNEEITKDPEHYRLFIYNHAGELRDMQANLNVDSKFNREISLIISK